MFKGKVHVYKNVDGKETEIKKEFDDEKEFDAFVAANPELREMSEWKTPRWPSFWRLDRLFREFEELGKGDLLDEMEDEMKELFERSRKLLK